MVINSKKLYLIDGANYVFRAYYAIRNLSNSRGFPTGALYGFTQMLLKLMRDEKPDLVAICFDTPEPTFRDEMYAGYKANRKAPPDELVEQFPYVRPIVEALGFPIVEKPGFEADDVIGTLAKKFSAVGVDVVIVSGDKDLMQLIGPRVSILDEMKELRVGPDQVKEKFGVEPERVVEILGLAGDSSDNIPGVPGVGPKTATTLIQKYGTVENVIASAGELKGTLAEKIRANADQARLSRKLAKIDTDVKIFINEEDLKIKKPDKDKLSELFTEFEFLKLLAEFAPRETANHKNYLLIKEKKELTEVLDRIKKAGRVSLDLETTSLNPMEAEIVGFALSWAPGEAAYIPVGHIDGDLGDGDKQGDFFKKEISRREGQLKLDLVLNLLDPLLRDASIAKVGQNLNYDLTILKRIGVQINGVSFDTMIASYLLEPEEGHGLDALGLKYLNYKTITYEEVTGKGKFKKNFAEVDFKTACEYASEDADVALRLADIFAEKIEREDLSELFSNMEMPLVQVLVDMQVAGVKVDTDKLKKIDEDFCKRLKTLEEKIHNLAGAPFNVNSPKQLGAILFEKMGLVPAKKTKTGFSTSQDVLEELAIDHELPGLVLGYRSLSKLKSTYVDSLPGLINAKTRRIHTSFNQAVAATGRLSSSNPNLQNIPIRGEEGIKIRESFVAEEGFVFLSADYSQIELRVLAHMSQDEVLLEAFERGDDVHAITASGIFGVDLSSVTKEQRSVGKTVNFATIYGQTAYGLSRQLGIEPGEAASYIENYFKKYTRVSKYREEIINEVQKEGFVKTLFGRRRFFPDINSSNAQMAALSERMAFNTVFQGTAADIIKQAMISIHKGLPKISKRSRMILQVHDELVFEVPENESSKVKEFVGKEMTQAAKLDIPLVVDVGAGPNWAEAH